MTPDSWPTVIYFLRSNYVLDFFSFISFLRVSFFKHVFPFFLFIIYFLRLNIPFIYIVFVFPFRKGVKFMTEKIFRICFRIISLDLFQTNSLHSHLIHGNEDKIVGNMEIKYYFKNMVKIRCLICQTEDLLIWAFYIWLSYKYICVIYL